MQAQRPKNLLYETLKTSSELGWSTLLAELRSYHRGESTAPVAPQPRIAIVVGGSGKGSAHLKIGGTWCSAPLIPGHIWLKPTGGKCDEGYTSSTAQVLDISLSAAVFAQLRNDFNLPAAPDHSIRYQGGVKDEVINQIGLSVLSEMMSPTAAGRMLVETSSLMLAARLLHAHFDVALVRLTIESRHQLDTRRLRRVLHYVEDHLSDDIAVADLASVAYLSIFHFTRAFSSAVGMPPHRYVSQRRLAQAKAMIATGDTSIAQISLMCRFSSQSSFTRAFRRAMGVTPAEYRRELNS